MVIAGILTILREKINSISCDKMPSSLTINKCNHEQIESQIWDAISDPRVDLGTDGWILSERNWLLGTRNWGQMTDKRDDWRRKLEEVRAGFRGKHHFDWLIDLFIYLLRQDEKFSPILQPMRNSGEVAIRQGLWEELVSQTHWWPF